MSFSEAASLSLVYDTAWFALRERGRLQTGETVLVLGASRGVGYAAVQLAHAMGARVLAGIARPEKAAAVRAAGADAVIDLSRANLRDTLREQAYDRNRWPRRRYHPRSARRRGVQCGLRALAWRGRLVVIGFAAGAIPSMRTNYLLLKNIEVSGLQISDYRKRRPAQVAAAFDEIFALFEQRKIRPAAATEFPLERAGEALAAVRDRRINGRAVLRLIK